MGGAVAPVVLGPNLLHRFYRGGSAIAAFRGIAVNDERVPEDWVGSTTASFGSAAEGLSRLPDGRLLRDAVAADPVGFLGPEHVRAFGADPALLVKLLHAAERLLVHCHPDVAFARRHLGCAHGKTEAWIVVATEGPRPQVHLGLRQGLDQARLRHLVLEQDVSALLASLWAVPVGPGDTVLVPAGVPHAVGAGVLLVELQEPTDFSVLLEWAGFPVDGLEHGHLGLGYDLALDCVDRSPWSAERLAGVRGHWDRATPVGPGVARLFPAAADPFFRAQAVRPAPAAALDPAYSILVVTAGAGRLEAGAGAIEVAAGQTILIPHGAGPVTVRGAGLEAVRCLPPEPPERP